MSSTHAAERLTIRRTEGTQFTLTLLSAGPQAPVVLVVPAMGVQAGYYGKFAEALRSAGHSVAVTELRGHEESGGRRPSWRYDFGYADLLTDLEQAVDAVAERLPSAPVFLLGHSLGGHLGSVYAGYYPRALAGLMLVATGSVWWRLWHRRMFGLAVFIDGISRVLGYFPGHRLGFAGREARRQMADWCRFNRTGRLQFGSPRIDHDPVIATATVPVLAASIEGDSFAPPKALTGLLAKFKNAPITRMHLGTDAEKPPGHLRWARQPEVVLPELTKWIGDHG